MDLGTFAAALRRRWYLVAVAVLMALGASYAAASAVGPTYRAEGSALLFPPAPTQSDTDERGAAVSGNPYLELGGLTTARDILIRSMSSQSARDTLAEVFPDADYELSPDPSSAGPVMLLSVTATSPGGATAALDHLLDRVPEALVDLQEGLEIEGTARITSRELTVDTRPAVVRKAQVRAGIVAGAGVLTVVLLLIGAFDGLASRRRTRRAGGVERATTGTDEDDPPRAVAARTFPTGVRTPGRGPRRSTRSAS